MHHGISPDFSTPRPIAVPVDRVGERIGDRVGDKSALTNGVGANGARLNGNHAPGLGAEKPVLEIKDREINVDAIMTHIRGCIQAKREAGLLRDEAWLSQRLDAQDLQHSARRHADRLALVRMSGRLNLEGDPIKSHRPMLGRAIVAFKKFTRYWTRKYTDPLFTRQTHYNAEVLSLVEELLREQRTLKDRVEMLERQAHGEQVDVPNSEPTLNGTHY